MSDNYPPDFDPDCDSGVHEDCLHIDKGPELFRAGLQAMREMLARFVEQGGGGEMIAQSLRANWNPSWGEDPGRPERVAQSWDEIL